MKLIILGNGEPQKSQLSSKQLTRLKGCINKYEWPLELDKFLLESVVRNYFNFDMVSLELNEEAKRLKLYFGATHSFTNEKARIRWAYLHMKVSQIHYKKHKYNLYLESAREGSQVQRSETTCSFKTFKHHQLR